VALRRFQRLLHPLKNVSCNCEFPFDRVSRSLELRDRCRGFVPKPVELFAVVNWRVHESMRLHSVLGFSSNRPLRSIELVAEDRKFKNLPGPPGTMKQDTRREADAL
jgi:hypothetical protein